MPTANNSLESLQSLHISGWDRFIRLMRIILPIAATLLASITMFWPFLNDNEVSFNLSTDDVTKGDSSIKMTNMKYVGTDAGDRLFHVEAASGLQDSPASPRVKLSEIRAEMALDDTGPATVTARTGIYRTKDSTLSLVGSVELITGNGYSLEMDGAEVDLKTHIATGQGTIKGQAKLGALEASRMTIYADNEEALFEGGVTIHIEPRRPQQE